ncbi:Fe-S cluster assembly protein SufD [Pontiella agarivorans]|uniref:Fe-S cluster assembly protein SufD n=1 Tax=Pontiella agarivorans TaxID=3038953 RepID=A0ABU5MTF4_9BACT|nr:Fe-S cluster assembly protein SufD [Pontiella agarivorans]MDZ8117490.1 Fe-S cluster assembly protein SufD [Pontiella agarivorans]
MDLAKLRQKAEADFKEVGFPTTKEELWRFTDVSRVANTEFSNDWKSSDLEFQALDKITVVFENGKLSREKSNFDVLPKGVCIGSILDLVDPRIGTLANAKNAFVLSNTAGFSDGYFIEVTEGSKLDGAIHVIHLADVDGAAFHLRNFVSAGEGAEVTVIEEYIGRSGTQYWTNVVTEVFVADRAVVDHYKVQRESEASFHFQTLESHLGTESVFSNHAVTFGAALGRNDIRGKLTGEEGEAICNGLYLLKDSQVFDTHMFMDHAVPKCNSHELYKGILDDKSRGVFCGRILVQEDAQETDAVQNNGNLLLSRKAKVNTLPQLEIYADDVKCTHGATVGELDEQALYYLQTRGIDPKKGHAMLVLAFANEVLDEVKCKKAKVYIEELVYAWLEKVQV